MERAEAIRRLPSTYAAIIEQLDSGASEDGIAEHLGIDPGMVPALVVVARAKLARLLAQ